MPVNDRRYVEKDREWVLICARKANKSERTQRERRTFAAHRDVLPLILKQCTGNKPQGLHHDNAPLYTPFTIQSRRLAYNPRHRIKSRRTLFLTRQKALIEHIDPTHVIRVRVINPRRKGSVQCNERLVCPREVSVCTRRDEDATTEVPVRVDLFRTDAEGVVVLRGRGEAERVQGGIVRVCVVGRVAIVEEAVED